MRSLLQVHRWSRMTRVAVTAALVAVLTGLGLSLATPAGAASTGTSASFTYTGTWESSWGGKSSWTAGSTAAVAVDVGSGGGTISIGGHTGTDTGKASIKVDAGSAFTVDTYRSTSGQRNYWTSTALAAGRHTVLLTILGTKNSASSGNLVSVNAVSTSNGNIAGSAPSTPTAANLTLTPGDGAIKADWTLAVGTDGANGAILSRDGTDTHGTGPWSSTNQPGASGSLTFTYLLNGTSYHITVQPTANGSPVGTATTLAATPAAAPPPANQSPTARFTASTSGLTASVDGSTTSDPDGSITGYDWNFGDGAAHASGVTASHTYAAGGSFTVTLTVTDNAGATGSTAQTVTVSAPPPASSSTAGQTLTAGDTTVTVNWTLSVGTDGATGVVLSRDGTDSHGTGPWSSAPQSGTSGTFVFTNLVNGTAYHFTAQPVNGSGAAVGTPVTAAATPAASGGGGGGTSTGAWLSGSTDTGLGDWRGRAIESVSTWNDSASACENQWTITGQWANWTGPLVDAIGAFDSGTWADAASGAMDAHWTTCLNALKNGWGSRNQANLYISFAHEANGTWYPWSVSSADLGNFQTAFHRFRNLQQQILPGAHVILSLNAEQVQGYPMSQILPAAADYDDLGLDMYSMHPLSDFDSFQSMAAGAGKDFLVQEWGTKNDEQLGFVQGMHDRFAQYAGTGPGKLIMENYFNLNEYQLEPTTTSPNEAAVYQSLW